MLDDMISKEEMELLPKRLEKIYNSQIIEYLNLFITEIKENFKQSKILIVGAGESYSVAIFVKQILIEMEITQNIDVMYPQDALKVLCYSLNHEDEQMQIYYDLVIEISYIGSEIEIVNLCEYCLECDTTVVLLTGNDINELSYIYPDDENLMIISYYDEDNDIVKGMFSIFQTVAPVSIFNTVYNRCDENSFNYNLKVYNEVKEFVEELEIFKIAFTIKSNPIIHIFYEYETYPAAKDLENKFLMSGLANVILHEKKEFLTGRYIGMYNFGMSLVINLNYSVFSEVFNSEYEYEAYNYNKELNETLKSICELYSACYLKVEFLTNSIVDWNFHAMMLAPYLIYAIGYQINYDVSVPIEDIPLELRKLYEL